MRKRILAITGVALCSCVFSILATELQAQTPAEKFEHLSQVLNLSPQQKTQLLPILEAEAPKVNAIKNNSALTPMQKMKELRAVHEESDPQIKAILSPQQYDEWQQIRQRQIQQAIQQHQENSSHY